MHGPAFFAREEKKRSIELYACFTNIEKCATLEIHLYPVTLTDKLDTMIIHLLVSFVTIRLRVLFQIARHEKI